MKTSYIANAMLLLVAILWGLTFPVIQNFAHDLPSSLFVFSRFALAALVILPFISFKDLFCKKTLLAGFILGTFNVGVYLLQTISLNYISAARCAFLTGTVVLWVPLFRVLLLREAVNSSYIIAGALCILGLWILTGVSLQYLTFGDGIMMIAEGFFALSLLYLEKVGFTCANATTLTFYQIFFTAIISFFIAFLQQPAWQTIFTTHSLIAIVFCGIFATALTLSLQVIYQRRTTGEYASVIFATEPLWAAIFSVYLFGETLTYPLIIGGAVILFSVVYPEFAQLLKKRNVVYAEE